MNDLIHYLKDIRFLIPAFFLVGFEAFMQSGAYRFFLEPNSYADNVNRIVNTVSQSPVEPDVYILGTSVAYQGIILPELNRLLQPHGITAQSGASEGAKLITQHLIYRSTEPRLNKMKVLIHVSESSYPWTARYNMDPPNMSMISQFPRSETLELLNRYQYNITTDMYSTLFVRTLTYRRDLRDFILDPLNRLKKLGRKLKDRDALYPYENQYSYSLASYQPEGLKDCVEKSLRGIPYQDESGRDITDIHHRRAVGQTCQLAMKDPMSDSGKHQWADLFFHRLQFFYNEVRRDDHRIITVIPPYSRLIQDYNQEEKGKIWEKNLKQIHADLPYRYWDLRTSLDSADNDSLYYDTIHLNRKGAMRFTRILAERIIQNKDWIKNRNREIAP